MELKELLEVSTLLNYYKNLLTDKQKEYLVEHLENDLSLSEIAKNNNVSRQAVHDNIKRAIIMLNEYEEKIGFYKKECEIEKMLLELKSKSTEENQKFIEQIIQKLF